MRRRLTGIFILAAAFATCTSSSAFAKTAHAKANFQLESESCGASEPGRPIVGKANFRRNGNTVTLRVNITHGRPNELYEVNLFVNFCELVFPIPQVQTNKKGVGKTKATFQVESSVTEVYATLIDTGAPQHANDTPHVTLP